MSEQCGFKAIRACQARELLPLVEDRGWFFDTELLVLAERAGLRIHEVPVDWIDDADSRVDIVATALGDLRGMARVGYGLATGAIKVPKLRDTAIRPPRGLATAPTLAEFEAMVAKGEIHYYVGQSDNSFGGGRGSSTIASWVTSHFKSQTVGGVTVYNLTQQK
jgi:hypothetical protein